MLKQQALCARARQGRDRFFPICILAAALTCAAAGATILWQHSRASEPLPYRAPSGVLLMFLGLLQAKAAWAVARRNIAKPEFHRRQLFWRWLMAGPVTCYLLTLYLGPAPGAVYFFAAAVAAWSTLALLPLVVQARWVERCRRITATRTLRVIGRLAFAALVVLLATESTIRGYGLVAGHPLPVEYVARRHVLPAGSKIRGQQVNPRGYWDNDFRQASRPGVFRIAAIGDGSTLCGTAQTNYLAQIERSVPGIEIYNFGVPETGPREYAAQLTSEIVHYQPDLALIFVSVGDDITRQLEPPGAFDWRGLGVYQVGARSLGLSEPAADWKPVLASYGRQSYLKDAAARLAVCRTPIDATLRRRWDESLRYLDQAVEVCRRRNINAALVVVPGEFQVNPTLCESVRRYAGYQLEELDLELPQRRLAVFAEQRHLAVLDLLPHFRAAGAKAYERNNAAWNEHGNNLAAEVLTDWIQHRYGAVVLAGNTTVPPK